MIRKLILLSSVTSLTFLLTGCSWLFPEFSGGNEEVLDRTDLPRIDYTTTFTADLDFQIAQELKSISLLSRLESRPPGSLSALKQRAKNDLKRLKQAMSSLGYFDAKVSYNINKKTSPISVKIYVTPGHRYTISKISIVIHEMGTTKFDITPSQARQALLLDIGDEVDLTKIHESALKLQLFFQQRGYALVKVADPDGQIDREAKKLHVTFNVTPGPPTQFGLSKIEGTKNVSKQFIRNRLVWHEGESFDERKIEKTRKKLVQSGLFSAVDIKPAEKVSEGNYIPIDLSVIEGPHRSLGAGIKYSSFDKLSETVFWHHNNLFGGGEHLGIAAEHSQRLKNAKINFNLPDFFSPEQILLTEVRGTEERTFAYRNQTISGGLIIQRPIWEIIVGSIGLNGEIGRVKRQDKIKGEAYVFRNRLLGFPLEVRLDASNDLLNPTTGGRLNLKVTPYKGKIGERRSMIVTRLGGTYYLPFLPKDRGILATWGTLGTIRVHHINDVSPNKRFYSGGGGSVRGYNYQLLGPVDQNRVPIGGRSLFECGFETRFKVTDTLGFVAFLEGGSVSEKEFPDLSKRNEFHQKNLLWGAGLGGRYFTTIGPIRFDLAFPLKIRHTVTGRRIDSNYQIYVSIGQAF